MIRNKLKQRMYWPRLDLRPTDYTSKTHLREQQVLCSGHL